MADTRVLGDWVSQLPEPIRHHILSFLKPEEAAKTSVLSKTWLSTYRTRPNLHFIYKPQDSRSLDDVAAYQVLERRRIEFLNCINTTLFRHRENKYGIDTLDIRLNEEFPSLIADLVCRWLEIAIENGVKSLNIGLNFSFVLPRTIFQAKTFEGLWLSGRFQLKSQVIKIIRCHGLRKLCLFHAALDELMLEKIMSSCPLIEILELIGCAGLVNVNVTSLQKLSRFSIEFIERGCVEVEAPNLEDFSYRSWIPGSHLYGETEIRSPCCLQMNKCKNLERLSLHEVAITDEFFLSIAENFPHLEDLKILDCYGSETIKVSSHTITRIHLKVEWNRDLKEARIDVPSIVRFEYEGKFIPLFSLTAPSGPWVSDIKLSCQNTNMLDASWFTKLKEFLAKLNQSEISLRIKIPPTVEGFIEDEMRNNAIFPLPQIEKLSIKFRGYDFSNAANLVLIFCACRPKTIAQYWYQGPHCPDNDAVKVLFEILVLRSNQKYSTSKQTKFWQQDLKGVKLEMFQNGQRVQCPGLSDWETVLKFIEPEGCNGRTCLVFDLEWETDMTRKHKRTWGCALRRLCFW